MLQLVGLNLNDLTADPSTPADGMIWYHSGTKKFRARRDGVTVDIATIADLVAYLQADGSVAMTGDLDAGGNKVINVANPIVDGDAANQGWTNDKIKQYLQALDPQEGVLDKDMTAPPGAETTGDRYIVAATATGAWVTHETEIAEWDGAAYIFTVPDKGTFLVVEDEGLTYYFNGTLWEDFGVTVATATAVSVGATNAEGSGSALAKAAHTHAVTDLAIASQEQGSILYYNGTNWVHLAPGADGFFLKSNGSGFDLSYAAAGAGSALAHKSGVVLNAAFSGTPQKATVTFTGAFVDANYSVVPIARTTNNQSFPISIESSTRLAGSFVLVLDSNDKTDLVAVEWVAIKHGEN